MFLLVKFKQLGFSAPLTH